MMIQEQMSHGCRLRPWGMRAWQPRSWPNTPEKSIALAFTSLLWKRVASDLATVCSLTLL